MFLNVSPRRHDEFMNTSPGASGADDVDRHRQHLDAVREAGPLAIAELLGDAHYVLANLVLAPGLVFDAEEHEPGEFVQLLDRIHEFNGALEGARARTDRKSVVEGKSGDGGGRGRCMKKTRSVVVSVSTGDV